MVPTPDPPPLRWYSTNSQGEARVYMDPLDVISAPSSGSSDYIVEIREEDTRETKDENEHVERIRKPYSQCHVDMLIGYTSVPAETVIDVLHVGLPPSWVLRPRPAVASASKVPLCLRYPLKNLKLVQNVYLVQSPYPIRQFDYPPLFCTVPIQYMQTVTESGLTTRRRVLPVTTSRDLALDGCSRKTRGDACVIGLKTIPYPLNSRPLGIPSNRIDTDNFHSLVAYWPVAKSKVAIVLREGSSNQTVTVFPTYNQFASMLDTRSEGRDEEMVVLTVFAPLHPDHDLDVTMDNAIRLIIPPQIISSLSNLIDHSSRGSTYEVCPWLLVGDLADVEVLKDRGVTHAVGHHMPEMSSGMATKTIDAAPGAFGTMIDDTAQFIDSARQKQGKCLIFAEKESLRIALLSGYVMRDKRWVYKEAIENLKSRPGLLSDGFVLDPSVVEELEKMNDVYGISQRASTIILSSSDNDAGMKILLTRDHQSDNWCIPGGVINWCDRLNNAENVVRNASLRHAGEETGINDKILQVLEGWEFSYTDPSDPRTKQIYIAAFAEHNTNKRMKPCRNAIAEVQWVIIQKVVESRSLARESDYLALKDIAEKMGCC